MLDSGKTPEEVCRDCPDLLPEVRQRWQEFRRIDAQVGALLPGLGTRPDLRATAPPATGLPQVPGYEVEAVLLARCAALAAQDAGLPEERRQALADEYGGRAVALLREAVDKGYKDLEHLKTDPELRPLRSRGDFEKLVLALEHKLQGRSK